MGKRAQKGKCSPAAPPPKAPKPKAKPKVRTAAAAKSKASVPNMDLQSMFGAKLAHEVQSAPEANQVETPQTGATPVPESVHDPEETLPETLPLPGTLPDTLLDASLEKLPEDSDGLVEGNSPPPPAAAASSQKAMANITLQNIATLAKNLEAPAGTTQNQKVATVVEGLTSDEMGALLEEAKSHPKLADHVKEIATEAPAEWQFASEDGDPGEDLVAFIDWLFPHSETSAREADALELLSQRSTAIAELDSVTPNKDLGSSDLLLDACFAAIDSGVSRQKSGS